MVSGAEKINDMRKASVEELAPFIDIPEDASAICRAQIIGLMTTRWTMLLVATPGWTLSIQRQYEVP